jgi:pimeloyl-ACP methyl ester carboxylesterase
MPTFNFIDRSFNDPLLLLPGWATDSRIFDTLDLPYNYILADNIRPFEFEANVREYLAAHNIDAISIFGWSIGGFLAAEFAGKHPGLIKELFLVGVRRKYDKHSIEIIKETLNKSKSGYLYGFYRDIFSKDEAQGLRNFKKGLMRDLIDSLELSYLQEGLDYLKDAEFRVHGPGSRVPVTFIHGEFDKIAPIEEVVSLHESLPGSRFVRVDGAGHAPFLSSKNLWQCGNMCHCEEPQSF